jgi:galactose mutarotase-like enzyme
MEKRMAAFMDFPTPREHVLAYGDTKIGVIPELSLVSHFQVGSWPVLYRPAETGNVKRWGLPLMIPNFSRLKDGIFQEKGTTLPIHGFGRDLPWSIVAQDTTSISIQLNSSDATRPNYPYEFAFTVRVVAGEGTLTYTLTMENNGDEVMPIAPGFHPYFSIDQSAKARLVADGPTGFDVSAFQWDTQPPDNPYPFPHSVTVRIPGYGTLTIAEKPDDGNYLLTTMQVWSEPVTRPDHAFVCFEPIVTAEDGLNRSHDRLNIAPHTSQQIVLQLTAQPF